MGAILDHLTKEQGFSMAEAKFVLSRWDTRPIIQNGAQVGELMIQNNEVHFALDRSHRKVLGRIGLVRNTLLPLLAEKKFLVTKLFKGDRYAPLVERLGFSKIRSDGQFDYYWMNEEDPIRFGLDEATHDSD